MPNCWAGAGAGCVRLPAGCANPSESGRGPRQIEVAGSCTTTRLSAAAEKYELRLVDRLAARPTMSPVAAAGSWACRRSAVPAELADWLEIALGDLDWFADLRALEYKRKPGRLRHYHYRTLAKRFGQIRLIEAPKARLKADSAPHLDRHPGPHPAARGCARLSRGRSVKTFAALHTGKQVVLRIDLQDFFPSISAARIQALFRTAGYPERVADLLAGLCTNAAPQDVWEDDRDRTAPRANPPGPPDVCPAPSSAGSADIPRAGESAAYRLDCRLSGLASSAGAIYTRYADDLAFSGDRDFVASSRRFQLHVAAIVMRGRFRRA